MTRFAPLEAVSEGRETVSHFHSQVLWDRDEHSAYLAFVIRRASLAAKEPSKCKAKSFYRLSLVAGLDL